MVIKQMSNSGSILTVLDSEMWRRKPPYRDKILIKVQSTSDIADAQMQPKNRKLSRMGRSHLLNINQQATNRAETNIQQQASSLKHNLLPSARTLNYADDSENQRR